MGEQTDTKRGSGVVAGAFDAFFCCAMNMGSIPPSSSPSADSSLPAASSRGCGPG